MATVKGLVTFQAEGGSEEIHALRLVLRCEAGLAAVPDISSSVIASLGISDSVADIL